MSRFFLSTIFISISTFGFGQVVEELGDEKDSVLIFLDTLSTVIGEPIIIQDEVILLADTMAPNFMPLPSELEFVPGDGEPAVVAARLAGLQKSVPLTYNDKIHAFINYFLVRDREHTRMVMRKKDMYFPMFEAKLKEHGLPDELKYLAIIESGLFPRAISRARAVGLWQFMPATGRYYGLKVDWYFDERMDPEKSTEAACLYLKQLYKMFNDWELVLAAYNSGPGNVRKAIRRSGYKKTFWEIYNYLPRETRAYVPQYVAMIYALEYYPEHNLFVDGVEEPMASDTLNVRSFLHLKTLADLTGACLEDIQRLNPSIQHFVIPNDGRMHTVFLPVETKQLINLNRYAILDSASKSSRQETEALALNAVPNTLGREKIIYTVKSGDAISIIAENHRVRVADVRAWNNLSSTTIRTGQKLQIWVLPSQNVVKSTAQPATVSPLGLPPDKIYTVQPGDTLWDISRKFEGLTIEKIKTLNNLKTTKLQPGQKLIVG